MGKSLWHIEHIFLFGRQNDTEPLSKGFGIFADIYDNIKYLTAYHADKLALCMLFLEMKSPEHAFCGAGLVVLYKYHIKPGFLKIIIVVCFHKISSGISEYSRLYQIEAFNITAFFKLKFPHGFPPLH